MTARLDGFGLAACLFVALAVLLPPDADGVIGWANAPMAGTALAAIGVTGSVVAWRGMESVFKAAFVLLIVGIAAVMALGVLHGDLAGRAGSGFWALVFALWALAWRGIAGMAAYRTLLKGRERLINVIVPILFGLWLFFVWEALCLGFGVPGVLLPAPSAIFLKLIGSIGILRDDLVQTFVKAVLIGYMMGCAAGFTVAVLVDRTPFLKRGLLPLGNLVSALPIVGVAPIMVMWFGFDWPSKAAVVVIMTFFPMLLNTLAGLSAAGAQELELMRSYGAGYWPTMIKLRLPAATPFIFNALKINSTLALIGAIVAEFFGTPIVGMGFRISTEVGRMNVDMVWAEIFVAALTGSAFYGVMALMERTVTFWHPSYRRKS